MDSFIQYNGTNIWPNKSLRPSRGDNSMINVIIDNFISEVSDNNSNNNNKDNNIGNNFISNGKDFISNLSLEDLTNNLIDIIVNHFFIILNQ